MVYTPIMATADHALVAAVPADLVSADMLTLGSAVAAPAFGDQARLMVMILAVTFMALEWGLTKLHHHDSHDLGETTNSLAIFLGNSVIRGLEAGIVSIPFILAYQYRLFDIPIAGLGSALLLFLTVEFFYYWHHRAAHRVRWLWATHAVHHSPTRLNYTSGVRLGWTGAISGNFLFFLPAVWLGFHPVAVFGMLALNLVYQFFIHTELNPHLGPLEYVLNTPRHHQVHHASNAQCLDKNYGGVLIIFDRLFGTFQPKPHDEPLRYGLVHPIQSRNPLAILFGEWRRMARDVVRARTLGGRFRALFGPP